MTDGKRETLTLSNLLDDQRPSRTILLETNRLVQQLALRGAKTLDEIEATMRIVDENISALNFSQRTHQALIGNGVSTIRQLLLCTQKTLQQKENIGRLAWNEIIDVLASHGLRLRETDLEQHAQMSHTASVSLPDQAIQPDNVDVEAVIQKFDASKASLCKYEIGDLVKHPSKEDWGIGKVLSVTVDGIVNVIFRLAGEKSISLKHVQLIKVSGAHTTCDTVDESSHTHFSSSAKTLCTNCGQPTQFGERAEAKRVDLGWCDSCFKQSQRTFKDSVTGETHYFDELRTIEGIKHRYYSPK